MIKEKKRELVDRRKFYYLITQKISENEDSASLNSCLTLREILETFRELPVEEEFHAKWIPIGDKLECSWCTMFALEKNGKPFPSRRCPYCGCRMDLE